MKRLFVVLIFLVFFVFLIITAMKGLKTQETTQTPLATTPLNPVDVANMAMQIAFKHPNTAAGQNTGQAYIYRYADQNILINYYNRSNVEYGIEIYDSKGGMAMDIDHLKTGEQKMKINQELLEKLTPHIIWLYGQI